MESIKDLLQSLKSFPIDLQKIYPRSFCSMNGLVYGLIRTSDGKKLIVIGEKGSIFTDPFKGKCCHHASTLKVCDLSSENTECLMNLFPYTKPISLRDHPLTLGIGDRLGVATPGYIRAIQKFRVHPVLAQQSVRETTQTGRDFYAMIQDAAWAVFQENYRMGYGADGDHLKSLQEVKSALDAGVSMITLDLSEKLKPESFNDPKESMERNFKEEIDEEDAKVILHLFLNKEFLFKGPIGEFSIRFDEESAKRNALFLHKATEFAEEVYEFISSQKGKTAVIDFEISIDEMPFPTSPETHLFFIIALNHRGVWINSFAPRFIGEFRNGVNDRRDTEVFCKQFYQHVLIAQYYGNYKISIHSKSDSFSLYPHLEELAKGGLHLKTFGTSWLEAMRLIAFMNPSLFREMYWFIISIFKDPPKPFHVTIDLGLIPKVEEFDDGDLPTLLDRDELRQLLHTAYGLLLNAKAENGEALYRDRFFQTLSQYEEDYWSLLEERIERQLNSLGLEKRESTEGKKEEENLT